MGARRQGRQRRRQHDVHLGDPRVLRDDGPADRRRPSLRRARHGVVAPRRDRQPGLPAHVLPRPPAAARPDADAVRRAGLSRDRLRNHRRGARRPVQRPAHARRAGGAGADDAVPGADERRRPCSLRARGRRRRAGQRPTASRAGLSQDAGRRVRAAASRPRLARPRAADGDAVGLLRRPRRAAGVDRSLRRHRLRHAAAPQRSRHPPRAGRAARTGRAHGADRGRAAGRRRRRRGRSPRRAGGTRQRVAAVRPVADRRHDLRDRRGAAGGGRPASPARFRPCAPHGSIRCWRCARTDAP